VAEVVEAKQRALYAMAQADKAALFDLARELDSWLNFSAEELDEDMVLPICKEIQAKAQAVANRVEAFVDLRNGEGR
jgi:seryl-tRNA(Sec) selenium transferase